MLYFFTVMNFYADKLKIAMVKCHKNKKGNYLTILMQENYTFCITHFMFKTVQNSVQNVDNSL